MVVVYCSGNNNVSVERPVCQFGAHVGCSRTRVGMLNDDNRNTKYYEAIKNVSNLHIISCHEIKLVLYVIHHFWKCAINCGVFFLTIGSTLLSGFMCWDDVLLSWSWTRRVFYNVECFDKLTCWRGIQCSGVVRLDLEGSCIKFYVVLTWWIQQLSYVEPELVVCIMWFDVF